MNEIGFNVNYEPRVASFQIACDPGTSVS